MRSFKLKSVVIAAAIVAVAGTLTTVASADIRRGGDGGRGPSAIGQHSGNRAMGRAINRGANIQNRNYSARNGNWNGRSIYNSRRFYGSYGGYNGYGNNYSSRRYGGGYGIYLNLGGGSGCNYYYRKWHAYGSSYWRNRYYDCVG